MLIKYIHLLAISTWLGGMIFFTTIGAPAIFKTLSRHDAGTVVGQIFPKYWILGYVSAFTLIVTLLVIGKGNIASIRMPLILLAVSAVLALTSGLVVGGKARTIKAEMRAEATPDAKKAELRKSFGKIHAVSAVLNGTILLINLVYLAFIPIIMKL